MVVPPLMLFLMLEQAKLAGMEVRADVLHRLNVASVAPLSRLDTLGVARIAKRADETARSLLHELSPDRPEFGVYCCAQFILTLIDEGRWTDPKNMAVLTALLLMDDVKDDLPDVHGMMPVSKVDLPKWEAAAKSILFRATVMGLYTMRM
jgi:hypothetical protein